MAVGLAIGPAIGTYAGSLLAARQLLTSGVFIDDITPKAALVAAVAAVAAQLGNTAAVCRRCYIHPAVLAAFDEAARFQQWISEVARDEAPAGLQPDEAALLRYLAAAPVTASPMS